MSLSNVVALAIHADARCCNSSQQRLNRTRFLLRRPPTHGRSPTTLVSVVEARMAASPGDPGPPRPCFVVLSAVVLSADDPIAAKTIRVQRSARNPKQNGALRAYP